MDKTLTQILHSQWRWNWIAAANNLGFHSPLEALTVIGTSIEKDEDARKKITLALINLGLGYPVPLPDLSTK